MRRSSAQPAEFSSSVGAGLGDGFAVELDGDVLTYTYQPAGTAQEQAEVVPDAAAWRAFRRSVERLKGWPWQGRYAPPPERISTDGTGWHIRLDYGDGRPIRCDGYDAFPPDAQEMQTTPSFRSYCRAVSRLVGGRPFGGQQSEQPAKAAVKGSQRRIREWVGQHRARFERELMHASPTLAAWADTPINWLSPIPDNDDGELRDDLWPLAGVHPTPQQAGWWPRRGPVWDAAGVLAGGGGLGIVLVEAKSHAAELRSPPTKASPASAWIIEQALNETKLALGVPQEAPWSQTYYQVANRLAFLHWLRDHKYNAWLFNIYFLGDRFVSGAQEIMGPRDVTEWLAAIADAKTTLQLPERHGLSNYAHDVFLPAEPRDAREPDADPAVGSPDVRPA